MTWGDAARLLRRTGFGATGRDVDAVAGKDLAATVTAIVGADQSTDPGVTSSPTPDFQQPSSPYGNGKPSRDDVHEYINTIRGQQSDMVQWWTTRMLGVRQPFPERLTLAWHSIFATGTYKVQQASYMVRQNETMRKLGRGDFHQLARAMLADPAMLWWLDGRSNVKGDPNENLGREFMELFALGLAAGYTEDDVREGARALTGWVMDHDTGDPVVDPTRHDDGVKTFLGQKGNFGTDEYCEIVLSQPASAPFVMTRLWQQLISDQPPDKTTLDAAVAAYGSGRDLTAGLVSLFSSDGFTAARGTKVVNPVEWTIGLARATGVDPTAKVSLRLLDDCMTDLGQQIFYPPSVGGWPLGQAWLSTASAEARLRYAVQIVAAGDLAPVADESPANRLDATAHLLGIPSWSSRSAAALKPSIGDPATLVAFAANTPEYMAV